MPATAEQPSIQSFCHRANLRVDAVLAQFVEGQVLAPLGLDIAEFWTGFADLLARFTPENRALLAKRDALQASIDGWHRAHQGKLDDTAYRALLQGIGYLVPEPAPFTVSTQKVDAEIATMAGPQLVVPC
jgi:malate synthase